MIILGALMAAPAIDDQIATGDSPTSSRPGWAMWGRVFLCIVVVAAFVCTLAIQTATTRMIYSMSRDEVLPASKQLRKVSAQGATVQASVLVGVLAAVMLLVSFGHAGVFTALTAPASCCSTSRTSA